MLASEDIPEADGVADMRRMLGRAWLSLFGDSDVARIESSVLRICSFLCYRSEQINVKKFVKICTVVKSKRENGTIV